MSSSSRFDNPLRSSSNNVTKQMSQTAIKLKAMTQLRQVLRSSSNRGALFYTLGKDLLVVLRFLPVGIMNKIQQFTSESESTGVAVKQTFPKASSSGEAAVIQVPKTTPAAEIKSLGTKTKSSVLPSAGQVLKNLTFDMIPTGSPGDTGKQKGNENKDTKSSKKEEKELITSDLKAGKKLTPQEPKFSPAEFPMDAEHIRFLEESVVWQNVESRTKYLVSVLVRSVDTSTSPHNLVQHIDELFSQLYKHPDTRQVAIEGGALRSLMKVLHMYEDAYILNRTREAMALLGHNPPTKGEGIKILSIDGGGVRGLVAIEVLRVIEKLTGKQIHELFDYICGVSTGSILAFLLGAHRRSLDECEALYKDLSKQIFSQNSFMGNANLFWSHAYYHTPTFEKILKKHCGETPLISLARDPNLPRVSAISTIVNQERVTPYVFRTYTLPPSIRTRYTGGCRYHMWEAVRASAAAPTYFEEIKLGNYLHQDGGVIVNNPTSVALSEARTIWPGVPLQCILSLGTGLTMSSKADRNLSDLITSDGKGGISSLSWKGKFLKVLDSATDTESVHNTLNELLPPSIYFRFNPYLTHVVSLDEGSADKLEQVQKETNEYLARNIEKVKFVSKTLLKPKGVTKMFSDWWSTYK